MPLLTKRGKTRGPFIADMSKGLESWGADFLTISCNSAHYYYDIVQNAVNIPVIHLTDLVCNHVKINFPDHDKIGILALPAVSMTRLYSKNLKQYNIEDVWPDPAYQDILFNVIKEVKKDNRGARVHDNYSQVCENLLQKGINTAIVACTKRGLFKGETPITTINAAEILAMEIVRQAVTKG